MRRRPLPASSAPFVTVVMVTIPGSDSLDSWGKTRRPRFECHLPQPPPADDGAPEGAGSYWPDRAVWPRMTGVGRAEAVGNR